METGEVVNEVDQDEIKKRDVAAQEKHRDNDHQGRIGQLFVTLDPLVLRLPWPGSFLQLGPDFTEEVFGFRDHEWALKREVFKR